MVTSACVISRPDGEVTWNLHLLEPWYVEPFETTLPRSFSYKSAVSRMPIVCTCPCSDIPRKLQKGRETSTASEGSTAALHLLHGRKTSWEAWRDLHWRYQCDSKCMYKLAYTTQPVAHPLTQICFPRKLEMYLHKPTESSKVQDSLPWTQHQPFGTVHLPLKSPFINTSQKSGAARQHRTGFEDVSNIFLGCNGMCSAEGGLSGLFNRFHWEWCKTLHQFMMDIKC